MASPQAPKICETTGRVLTEWFELEERSDADIERLVLEEMGLDEAPTTQGFPIGAMPPEVARIYNEFQGRTSAYKRRAWKNGMSQQEVAQRMNEATKMINPDNFKFLPEDVRKRTGLEVNPLWAMECLYRSGLLPPKEQITLLTQLASYTHSKAPSLSHNTNVNLKPEDWLLEISKEEYQTVDEAQVIQPLQRRENGSGGEYETRRLKRDTGRHAMIEHQVAEQEALLTELGDYYVPEGLPEFPDADDA